MFLFSSSFFFSVDKVPQPLELNCGSKPGRSYSYLLTILDGMNVDMSWYPPKEGMATAHPRREGNFSNMNHCVPMLSVEINCIYLDKNLVLCCHSERGKHGYCHNLLILFAVDLHLFDPDETDEID